MDPSGLNQLQTVYANQRAMSQTPGGIMPGAYSDLTKATSNIASTGKTLAETQNVNAGLGAKLASGVIADPSNDATWREAVNKHYDTFGGPSLEKQQLLGVKDPAQRLQIARAYAGQGMSPDEANKPVQITPGNAVTTPSRLMTPPTATSAGPANAPIVPGLTPGQKATQTSEAEATTKYLQDDGHKTYSNAQSLLGSMVNVDHDVENLGPAWMGPGTQAKASFVKGINSALSNLGVSNENLLSPDKVATSEELGKETIRAGMQLINSNFGGSREAASIIQMGGKAVVGQQNSYLGAKYVSATIKAAAQRQIDLYEYQADHKDQLPAVSEIQFNKAHPPQQYAMGGITSVIPQGAKNYLTQHPETAPQFNKNFGSGTAQYVLANPQQAQ